MLRVAPGNSEILKVLDVTQPGIVWLSYGIERDRDVYGKERDRDVIIADYIL